MIKLLIFFIVILFCMGIIDSLDPNINCRNKGEYSAYNYPYRGGCELGERFLNEE